MRVGRCRHLCAGQRADGYDPCGGRSQVARVSTGTAVASTVLNTAETQSGQARGTWQRVWRRLRQDKVGLAGILVVLVVSLMTLLAPVIAPGDPTETHLELAFRPAGSPDHVLGTDLYGRDILSRVIWGARPSLAVGFAATCFALAIGATLGMVISFKNEQFVEAGRSMGATNSHLMRAAILPNVGPYIIVAFSINIGYLILEAASLSFLGLGAQPPSPEWGAMLAENRNYLTLAPITVIAPGAAIFLIVLGLSLFGDALRDAFDVRLRED